jgi:hypothetical protein
MRGEREKTQIAVQNNNDMPEMKSERVRVCVCVCEREREREKSEREGRKSLSSHNKSHVQTSNIFHSIKTFYKIWVH